MLHPAARLRASCMCRLSLLCRPSTPALSSQACSKSISHRRCSSICEAIDRRCRWQTAAVPAAAQAVTARNNDARAEWHGNRGASRLSTAANGGATVDSHASFAHDSLRTGETHGHQNCRSTRSASAHGSIQAQHAQQAVPPPPTDLSDESYDAPQPYEPTLEQRQQLDTFVAFLLEESQKYNLTGAKTAEEIYSRHVDDCLALLPVLDSAASAAAAYKAASKGDDGASLSNSKGGRAHSLSVSKGDAMPSRSNGLMAGNEEGSSDRKRSVRILDIGSGAGLPGLLLAICRPQWQVVMLDSLRKRCTFLEAAVERLKLTNATVLWARAEDAGQNPEHRESFDVVTARAVADMRVLAELTLPFIRRGGRLAVAKGANPQEEVESAGHAIKELGGADATVCHVASHGPKGQRTTVVVSKAAPTPSHYPRAPKQISRQPL